MKIMLKPFAMLRESLPSEAKNQELEAGSTVTDLLAKLQHNHPTLKPVLQCTRVAYKDTDLVADEVLEEGGEYALIPPVSGG
jgi:molybdopterin converting factor small subunit